MIPTDPPMPLESIYNLAGRVLMLRSRLQSAALDGGVVLVMPHPANGEDRFQSIMGMRVIYADVPASLIGLPIELSPEIARLPDEPQERP
jgi:hypothetical protein